MFGEVVRNHRHRLGLTQEELAARTGVGLRTIREIEAGRVLHPRPGTVRLLAEAFGLEGAARERFCQVTPAEPPPHADRVPAQLPPDVAGFTGRHRERALLDAALSGPEPAGIVVLSGTAGVGKTALAVHWAHAIRSRYPDGQLYVNLRGYAHAAPVTPADALAQLLRSLGVPPDQVPTDVDEAAGLYRSCLSDLRVLVLLDNAGGPDQVRPLLPGTPGCLVLVTSRNELAGLVARHGAHRLSLDVLTTGDAGAVLASVLGADRVAADVPGTAHLSELCARLPLALRIAAAKLAGRPEQPIGEFAAELRTGDRLAALAIEGDEEAAVRTAFELSYTALAPAARRVFRMLGLAPGPDASPESAAALAGIGVPAAAQLLETLTAAHLIGRPRPGRFAFHDLLRGYAAQLAGHEEPEAERQAATVRLLEYYRSRVDGAALLLYPEILRLPDAADRPVREFPDPSAALAWLDAERANLTAAVAHAAEHGPRALAWRLADALRGYLWQGMHLPEWPTVARAGLAAAEAEGDRHGRAAAHASLGTMYWVRGSYDESAHHHRAALALAEQAGWLGGQGTSHNNLGNVYRLTGRPAEAAEHVTRARALNRQAGRRAGEAANVANLGEIDAELGRLASAADRMAEAVEIFRTAGARAGMAHALQDLGELHRLLGRFPSAVAHLTEAHALQRELGDSCQQAESLATLADVHADLGRLDEALRLASVARELTGERGTVRTVANCLRTLGYVHERLGRYRQALAWYWQAGVTAETAGDRYAEAQILVGLASASRALGRTGAAVRYVTRALAVTRRNGYRAVEGQALTVLAAIHLDREEPAAAIREAERALVIHRDGGYRLGLAHTHRILGTAGAGAEHLRSAAELFAELGVPDTAGLPDPAGREAASLPEPAGREAAGQLPVNGLVSGRRPG